MAEPFPNIEEVKTTDNNERPNVRLVCEKHGDLHDEYVFRVNMPDHGYDRKMYCLVCAIDYLSMIASEVEVVPLDEEKTDE